jgi:hypothetical protein
MGWFLGLLVENHPLNIGRVFVGFFYCRGEKQRQLFQSDGILPPSDKAHLNV